MSDPPTAGPTLRKSLTLLDVFMLGISGMVGSAWLFSALGAVGFMGPAAVLSWIIAGIFFSFMVFGFAELGGLFPFTGSLAVAFLFPFPTWYAIMSISSLATVYNTFWLSCPFRININGVLYSNTCDRSHG